MQGSFVALRDTRFGTQEELVASAISVEQLSSQLHSLPSERVGLSSPKLLFIFLFAHLYSYQCVFILFAQIFVAFDVCHSQDIFRAPKISEKHNLSILTDEESDGKLFYLCLI
jgi:hypothetical protein